jgi:hypothetical protein
MLRAQPMSHCGAGPLVRYSMALPAMADILEESR